MSEVRDVTISRVGAQGDGVAEVNGAQLFVPFTLTGERVRVEVADGGKARSVEILEASADRIAPVCRHFGRCGGCAMQHMEAAVYRRWKRDQVVAAFRARAVDAPVAELVSPTGGRRRAVMTVRNSPAGVVIGFHEAGSHDLVDVIECPVLESSIVAAMPKLRSLIAPLLPRREAARVTVTAVDPGLDVALEGIEKALTPALRSALAQEAAAMRLARVSVGGETVYEAFPAAMTFGAAHVVVPPGVFIQAVAEAERAMAARILAALDKTKSVVELFSGVGAFTFPIAAKSRVAAFDSDARAIDALLQAARMSTGLKPITALRRDLFREPLSALELNEHDAIVLDPPRAGAEAQAHRIAKCKVKTVVAVSCNPATLARDARILIDGGYSLEDVTPIDQFRYSPHIEAVAVFRR
ncbi:MAG: class I SAM-dependent RNA methyltransferase [Hyphomicrobium sp.]